MSLASSHSRLSAASLASEAKRHAKMYPQRCKQMLAECKKRLTFRRMRGEDGSGQAKIGEIGLDLKARLGYRESRVPPSVSGCEDSTTPGSLLRSISNPSKLFSHKRRIDWDAEDTGENKGDSAGPSKKTRICVNNNNDDEAMQEVSCTFSIRVAIAKWRHPYTSPLGPQTSVYRRQSRLFSQPAQDPGKSSSNLAIRCMLQAFEVDNRRRVPYYETPQWCEDLHLTGLNQVFHPNYTCTHTYHPSDPEYDEELDNDMWNEDEWSDTDGEDEVTTLSDGSDDQDVRIFSPAEEESDQPAMAVDEETSSQWNAYNPSASGSEQCLSTWEHEVGAMKMQIVTT